MTNLEGNPEVLNCESSEVLAEVIKPRSVKLTTRTGIKVDRLLPSSTIRMIGPWCFLDHFLPHDKDEIMSVAAHPHAGLQTVTWLFSGEVHHHDSLGSDQKIFPGELNLMTAGKGISHSEISNKANVPLHGVQLWVALDEKSRNIEPRFSHYDDLPEVIEAFYRAKILAGQVFGIGSNTEFFSPLIAAEITISSKEEFKVEINNNFEHGVMAISEKIEIANQILDVGELYYQPTGASFFKIKAPIGSKLLLIGGEPFTEEIVMWWNFVGRSHEEIAEMRNLWETKSKIFGEVHDDINERIPAPIMPMIKLKPRANKKLG